MKVFDRYAGTEVSLPKVVTPGRYRLLKAATLNTGISLAQGDVLVSDGQELCEFDGSTRTFQQFDASSKDEANWKLLTLALAEIAKEVRSGKVTGVSPLLPSATGQAATPLALEREIEEQIGHLQEIDRLPRFSIHYETDVSPLSRAKRLAPNALTYLAAHSEDWHRRTISSVKPKRVLALFSDDQWAIYENCIYARLLDLLDRHLSDRLYELNSLKETLQEALELTESMDLDFRIRESLCSLWGEAQSMKKTASLLDETAETIEMLGKLARKIANLKQGELYRHIPRGTHVPAQLRDTNILVHDQHYRHLRTLWLLYQKRASDEKKTGLEIHALNQRLFENYLFYTGMILTQVISETCEDISPEGDQKLHFNFAGREGLLERSGKEWNIGLDGVTLTFVPVMYAEKFECESVDSSRRRVLVALTGPDSFPDMACLEQFNSIVVHPKQFYGIELIKSKVIPFLWKSVLRTYGVPINPLPKPVTKWFGVNGIGKVDGDGWDLPIELSTDQQRIFTEWIPTAAINTSTRDEIVLKVSRVRFLSTCHICGQNAHFLNRGEGFFAECNECGIEWGVYSKQGKRRARFSVKDSPTPTFRTHGALHWDVAI